VGSVVDFEVGEQFRVGDLVRAMLISSGNDAAISLADHYKDGYEGFVHLMNQEAIDLGLKETHFVDVSGLDAPEHYSTAYDLSLLMAKAIQNPLIRKFVAKKTDVVTSLDGMHTHKLVNTNELLGWIPGVIGIKTGTTDMAQECLATLVHRDRDMIIVVLGSQDRFGDTIKIIDLLR
jgi:D-alanyl-D-alanine carboxypeptidase (penicillin-binding protein 5/6)